MSVITLTAENFTHHVLSHPGPVLVDFYAVWCTPCTVYGPTVEDFAMRHPEVRVCKADVDTLGALASQYHVQSVPTTLLFRDGQLQTRMVGVLTSKQLDALL